MAHKILLKRGLSKNRLNYIPEVGELIIETDTKLLYIGDGETLGGHLIRNCRELVIDLENGQLEANFFKNNLILAVNEDWEKYI